ncbi:Hcp [Paraburkholderia caffeinilytica]|uniref:T6SS Phospholipase effector Tle1-like catalytic domain-containing protein n=1 Tax=Paraburkholderia caffeinilytica TaxID=1761016 RepID=A0ABQ1M8R8_9BURK|nr:DUF2235 domain-containing protein [Paraburkholderia caffeinilytica]AXL52464.1 Hcp [Paraburkholderia caffeinilytica]GGC34986.1 hypothetical protein GCM10011400_22010 [Paraburkholderia caffeinilytica]CAB3794039.1 hypothetical protein LMG28690_03829 [Paraburkholderia caffeinilytica]
MTVRQASAPITDKEIDRAVIQGVDKRAKELFAPSNKDGPYTYMDAKCRLYPKLSFFFDGTNNNLERDQPLDRHSNIAKLFGAAVDDRRRLGSSPRYIPGVGTPFRFPKVVGYTDTLEDDPGGALGLGLGAGGDMRIKFALAEFSRILEREWGSAAWKCMQFINVAIFGFSRGATQARTFVRRLIDLKSKRTDNGLVWLAPNGERVPLRINFMGLFDTVASVGGPTLHLDWASELAIPPEVERCVHYVSAHEVRQAFPLDSVRVGRTYPVNCEEVVYPGVHSDVGGGYAPDEQGRSCDLARIPLRHMLADALRAGVPMQLPRQLPMLLQPDYSLPDDNPVSSLYQDYMTALPEPTGNDLEALIHAHRRLNFRWRGMLARQRSDLRVLGQLYGKVNRAACASVPPATDQDHPPCRPNTWIYDVPAQPEAQAKQLLGEQRRLMQQIAFLRNPVESRQADRDWPPPPPRPLTDYERLILSSWDDSSAIPPAVDSLLAEYVHDSVAPFTSWPCALHEPRGVYCDGKKYYAHSQDIDSDTQAIA